MLRRLIAGLAAFFAVFAATGPAVAMSVQPIVVSLTTAGRGMSQVIVVKNTFSKPLPVEIRVEELSLTSEGARGTGKDPGDLVVFPPQAIIQPGQTQSFRVQYVGDPGLARSKHYYVSVAQLPVQAAEGESQIQVLYNFQVLVSVAPAGATPAIAVEKAEVARTDDGRPVAAVTFTNSSAAHGYVAEGQLRLTQRDSSGKEVFRKVYSGPELQQLVGVGLVGSGQARRMLLPVELPASGGTLEAQFKTQN